MEASAGGVPRDADGSPSVLLCDDAVAFSAIFRRWMMSCGAVVVGQAQNGDEAVARATELHPDVIVVDHLLRDITSERLAPRLREAAPEARLLLISGMPNDRLAVAARAAGVDAHLSKAATAQAMCDAVLALAEPREG